MNVNGTVDDAVDAQLEGIREKLQTKILVLLRMFCEYDPSLKQDQGVRRLDELMANQVQSVEVVWKGKIQRHFFHVPRELCK